MERGSREQQAPVNDLAVLPCQEIRQAQHIGRMHQQPRQEAVVHAFGGGDAAESLQVPLQHGLGENAVIPVLHRGDQAADLFQGLIPVNGGHRHQGRHIVAVLLSGHADIGGGELNAPPVFRHIRTNFYHLSGIRWRAHRAGVVPGL